MMRRFLVTVASILAGCPAFAEEAWMHDAVLALRNEPKIVDVKFPNDLPTSLWVSVQDDGSNRDGYAEYVCLVLQQSGMPPKLTTAIHVLDAAALARGEMTDLGKNECEFSE